MRPCQEDADAWAEHDAAKRAGERMFTDAQLAAMGVALRPSVPVMRAPVTPLVWPWWLALAVVAFCSWWLR